MIGGSKLGYICTCALIYLHYCCSDAKLAPGGADPIISIRRRLPMPCTPRASAPASAACCRSHRSRHAPAAAAAAAEELLRCLLCHCRLDGCSTEREHL